MLTIGQNFPEFQLIGVFPSSNDETFKEITNATYSGKWLVLFAWPKDFSGLCPTEIIEFGRLNKSFEDINAQILGMSVDTDMVHKAWRESRDDLRNIPFPFLSDVKHELSSELGILSHDAGVCNRATFIIDPKGVIRHVSINDLKVGRNIEEILRVLAALQTDAPTPCGWQREDATLKAAS